MYRGRRQGNYNKMVLLDFTDDFDTFVHQLDMLQTHGGDKPLANVFGGLLQVGLMQWRKNSTKLVYHCADMPGHGTNYNNNLPDQFPDNPDYKLLFSVFHQMNFDYHFLKVCNTTDAMLAHFREHDVPLGYKITEEKFDHTFDIVKSITFSSTMTSTLNFTNTLTSHNIALSNTGITDLDVDNSVTRDPSVTSLNRIPCTFYELDPIHDIKQWLLEFKSEEFFMQYRDFSDKTQEGVFSVERSKFKQGACRRCYDGVFIRKEGKKTKYTTYSMKQYKKGIADDEYEPYTQQAQLTNIAAAFAKEFNKGSKIKIQFITAGIIEARMQNGENELFNVEPRLPAFYKFVSNNGKTNKDHDCSTG